MDKLRQFSTLSGISGYQRTINALKRIGWLIGSGACLRAIVYFGSNLTYGFGEEPLAPLQARISIGFIVIFSGGFFWMLRRAVRKKP